MEIRSICSWQDLCAIPDQFKKESWIFRGVEDHTYELIPKIGRCDSRRNFQGTKLGYPTEAEARAVERFKREARPLLAVEPRSELDWLAVGQHHGLPTRLLDWTESPLIAAFFALKPAGILRGERVDAAVYGLPPPPVVMTDDECTRSSEPVVSYYPRHLTPRITAQRGLFTYHRMPNQLYLPPCCIKWVLPSMLCFDLKLAIHKCGISDASMFPDLDGLARNVDWLHKWSLL